MPKTQTTQKLTLERTYKQSPAKVWAAWTDSEAMRAWFFPGDVASVVVERFDVRTGGELRVRFEPGPMGTPTAVGTSLALMTQLGAAPR